jgi:hypothetical protein
VQPLSIAPVQRRLDARLAAAPIVQLNIGRLSLRGVTPAEGRRIAGAFERELRIQLASQPLPLHSARPNALRLPPLQRAAGERPESTGRRLARLVALQWQGGHDRGPGGHGP